MAHSKVETRTWETDFNKTLIEFFYCHDLGHFLYECPKKNREKKSQAHFAKTSESLFQIK